MILNAEAMFEELPLEIKKRFDNDPAKLVEFCNDPKNLEEAIEIGLAPASLKPDDANASNVNASKAPASSKPSKSKKGTPKEVDSGSTDEPTE